MITKGIRKTAAPLRGMSANMTPPKDIKVKAAPMASSVPKRVGGMFQPGNPIKNLRSVTGKPAMAPFGRALKHFGKV
jgi:hypothetical protein